LTHSTGREVIIEHKGELKFTLSMATEWKGFFVIKRKEY
jgi:hypothetical protein